MFHLVAVLLAAGCGPDETLKKPAEHKPAETSTKAIPMKDAWTRIHSWLAANAPKISHSLSPAASVSQLAVAEQALGREMPAEWRELYQTHNGMSFDSNLGSLFYGMKFLTLDDAVREHSNSNADGVEPFVVKSADPGINRADMCNPHWIAFARSGDTLLCVDTDPGTDGCVGQVIFVDHAFDTVILLAKSLPEFLAEFARDLEGGKYSLNQDALQDGSEFLDCAPEIDIVNWHRTPRWKHLDR